MAARQPDLYSRIWNAVRRIPKGKVTSYGEIARHCGFPRHARLVGYALHNLPLGSNIPWHRVVNSQGKISLPKRNGHYQRQKQLLEKEGVVFLKERTSMTLYGSWSVKKRTR